MTEFGTADVLADEAEELKQDFLLGPILDDAGRRFLTEAEVDRMGGLVIQVFSREHPPPHFRVAYQGETANYEITTGRRLNGGLATFDRNIRKWWKENKLKLARAWNDARPADCPVGIVDTVALGWEAAFGNEELAKESPAQVRPGRGVVGLSRCVGRSGATR
jgi:hypothetical protein